MKVNKQTIISLMSDRAISFAKAIEKACCSYEEHTTGKHLIVQIGNGNNYWSRLK